jgi:hypothetical protein
MNRPSYPIGDIVALMRTRRDADDAAGVLDGLGVVTVALEPLDHAEEQTVLIVHHPGRSQIAEIRRILRMHRARRARYYRAKVIEELVRVSGSRIPDLGPLLGSARTGGHP